MSSYTGLDVRYASNYGKLKQLKLIEFSKTDGTPRLSDARKYIRGLKPRQIDPMYNAL